VEQHDRLQPSAQRCITLAKFAAGFRISVGTAHAYVHAVLDLLAHRAPGLTRALREADAAASSGAGAEQPAAAPTTSASQPHLRFAAAP
jgi:hypothetical protein